MIICLDGPAGSGKSTISRMLAQKTGMIYLDTGAIYRSLAYLAKEKHIDWTDEDQLAILTRDMDLRFEKDANVVLNGEDVTGKIRTPEISKGSSVVSKHPKVRAELLGLQRAAAKQGDVVAEGRDTGTVVFPDAFLKIYLDATAQERARRRTAELHAKGIHVDMKQVQEDIELRDRSDSERDVAPLRSAPDAIILDTTGIGPDEVVERILRLIHERSTP